MYFTTLQLMMLVSQLKRPNMALLDMFFPLISTSQTKEVVFEIENGARRLAPFCSPKVAGKVVEALGREVHKFEPAYIKDKRVFDPDKPLTRMAGESIGGSVNVTPEQRANAMTVKEMADQIEMIQRRLEQMCAEFLVTGSVTVSGEGFETQVLNFGRKSGQSLTLTGATRWGESGVSPVDDVDEWCTQVEGNVSAVVMGKDAMKLYKADPKFKDKLEMRRGDTSANFNTTIAGSRGLKWQGNDGVRDYYIYDEVHVDPETGNEKLNIPSNAVIVAGPDLLGCRHFAAIQDKQAGWQALEFFPKTWHSEDPAVDYLMMQSAPVVAPYRPNASMGVIVR